MMGQALETSLWGVRAHGVHGLVGTRCHGLWAGSLLGAQVRAGRLCVGRSRAWGTGSDGVWWSRQLWGSTPISSPELQGEGRQPRGQVAPAWGTDHPWASLSADKCLEEHK